MARLIELDSNKTYATYENAVKAVEKKLGNNEQFANQRYIIYRRESDGRYFPVMIGLEALHNFLHFHFTCVA